MPSSDDAELPTARWGTVDRYLAARLIPPDPVLDDVLAANEAAGLPAIDVSPLQGRLLALLVTLAGARRVLELGTLGAYSSICMARQLPPDGELVTIEADARHHAVARANIERAGLGSRIRPLLGAALDVLPSLTGPFDLVFIDADKPNNPSYLRAALRLSRPGTTIVIDNVVRRGAIVDGASGDASVRGVQLMLDIMATEPRLAATAVQTVGAKGWDGFVLAHVGMDETDGGSGGR